jgi:hypothetical protein
LQLPAPRYKQCRGATGTFLCEPESASASESTDSLKVALRLAKPG